MREILPSVSQEDLQAVSRLRLLVVRLERRIRQQSETDLTPSQLSALTTIDRRGPLRLGDLARRERISKASVTRLVTRLEARGHVTTVPDPVDGRGSIVALTAQGNRLLTESRQRVDAYLARGVLDLTDEQRHQLYAALSALELLVETPR
jgi:DNA-binding MarR family transcriptional regulator